jgi:hypothetical protein
MELKRCLLGVASNVLRLMLDDSVEDRLREESKRMDANFSMRFYPKAGSGSLGAHVDGNVMTILWTDGPGLQVPRDRAGITGEDIRNAGLPSLANVPNPRLFEDDMWVDVPHAGPSEDTLLVSYGNGWFQEKIVSDLFPGTVESPLFHRVKKTVVSTSNGSTVLHLDRHSLPLLVRIEKNTPEEESEVL